MLIPDWRTYPPLERHDVTICIAAACEVNYDPQIVVCSDWQYGSSLGSAEIGFKQRFMRPGWGCLFAGDVSAARTLLKPVEKHFKAASTIDETNVLSVVRAGLNERKKDMANEYSYGEFAISYDDLLKFGKEKLPEHRYRAAIDHIASLKLGAELIIFGFVESTPTIVETDEKCGAIIKEHFATIGEGRYLAHSVMLHRSHQELSQLGTTLYRVFEAKKYAERVRSVGTSTSLLILSEEQPMPRIVGPSGLMFLEKQYAKYGPKELNEEIQFDDQFLSKIGNQKNA